MKMYLEIKKLKIILYRQIKSIKLQHSNKNGFSLIELMFSILMLTIGILGVAAMQVTSLYNNGKSAQLSNATFISSSRLETLMALPYTHIDLSAAPVTGVYHTPGMDSDGADNNLDGTIDEPGETGSYSVFWNVRSNHMMDNTLTITVTTNWTHKNETKAVTIWNVKPYIF